LGLLAEKELNASEISIELDLPLNTIGYNLEKLIEAGLIEKSKGFLWSVKGKRIEKYRVVNKRIIISPRKLGTSIIPVVLISGIFSVAVKWFTESKKTVNFVPDYAQKASIESGRLHAEQASLDLASSVSSYSYESLVQTGNAWLWFLLGSLIGIMLFVFWNRNKIWGKS
jgi:DNA-binding transcriptional ArsR family regulator